MATLRYRENSLPTDCFIFDLSVSPIGIYFNRDSIQQDAVVDRQGERMSGVEHIVGAGNNGY